MKMKQLKCKIPIIAWWKTIDEDETVEVQNPHHRHGLAGKPSNPVVMKVRENCFGDSWKDSPLHVKNTDAPGILTVTYSK